MTEEVTVNESRELRKLMQAFVDERLELKLKGLKPEEEQQQQAEREKFELNTWLSDAVKRVGQIQLATHILKPMHPEARGTNLHVVGREVQERGVVGSHCLGQTPANDVVGNAAALDVFKFLSVEHQGVSILERVLKGDADVKAALSDDAGEAEDICSRFAAINDSNSDLASHTLAKQLFFPMGSKGTYHLLAPLFPTSLVHEAYHTMRDHRYGEEAKAARAARKKGELCALEIREYPNLAIQKFGGTKPQNISQLNSQRYGENWLLSSLPPNWQSVEIRAPLRVSSVFDRKFGGRRQIRELTARLRKFLQKTEYNNASVRARRAELVERICDEALQYAANLRTLEAGWTASAHCELHESEKLWLDPDRALFDEEFGRAYDLRDWPGELSARFANWLNQAISPKGKVLGDSEHEVWKKQLHQEIGIFRDYLEADRD